MPQRGDKRELQETVTRNAKEEFTRHRLRRASDHNSRARALNELQDALGLPEAPLRIECYDMSHIQGTDYVGSMVVMEDGLPKKSEYRRFKVKGVAGNDDFAAMEEVLTRRLTAYLDERDQPVGRAAGQVRLPAPAAAGRRRQGPAGGGRAGGARSSGLDDEIPVASLAKRFEEVYVPGQADPVEHPPPVRGAVPAAAHPRRGPPLRHHLPPRAAGQAHDEERARRRPRAGPDRAQAAGQGAGRRDGGQAGRARASCRRCSWLPDAVAEAVYAKIHGTGTPALPAARTDAA